MSSTTEQEIDQIEDATEKSVASETEESVQPEEAEATETTIENEPISFEQEAETPAPKPKRGGNRRSRKRRGGPRKVVSTNTEAKQAVSSEEIQPNDDTEIEVTGHKKEVSEKSVGEQEEEEENEEEEEREPSPVVTRRSNRKLQQQIKEDSVDEEVEESMEVDNERVEEDGGEGQQELLDLDQDEVESVASELESIASSSTLTTRSRRTKGSQDSVRPRRRGKVVKKSGINSTNVKGKSRRAIFKKSATRAPSAVAKAVTSERVYYRGQYFTKGDIVSVEDMDGSVYYAQLRGFLTDQYCEKSGVITWLLPTTNR